MTRTGSGGCGLGMRSSSRSLCSVLIIMRDLGDSVVAGMRPDRLSCSSASLLMFDLLTLFFLRLVRLIDWLVLEQQRFHGGQSRTIKK